ncbi:hypothetical protein [Paludibacterium sp.]|uniref:hypothetical protein n=1 Tax=Paludibacterium sp. TaxID=1917523 RepID=UPI0025D52E25|nr:hypothetical protein [Paludibacterium sp.]MBV8649613.1 hypothetical protein [Paludibacterium sp.]
MSDKKPENALLCRLPVRCGGKYEAVRIVGTTTMDATFTDPNIFAVPASDRAIREAKKVIRATPEYPLRPENFEFQDGRAMKLRPAIFTKPPQP